MTHPEPFAMVPTICWPWGLRHCGSAEHTRGAECRYCRRDVAAPMQACIPCCLYCGLDRGLVEPVDLPFGNSMEDVTVTHPENAAPRVAERESGWYWVTAKPLDPTPFIAWWNASRKGWEECGSAYPVLYDWHVRVLSGPLAPPSTDGDA